MQPEPKLVNNLVTQIVEAVQPLRIVLFGSAARGQMGPNSDLDVLVVMPDGTHRRKTAQFLYRHLIAFGFATDIIVATPTDLTTHAENAGLVYKTALTEGREIYHVPA